MKKLRFAPIICLLFIGLIGCSSDEGDDQDPGFSTNPDGTDDATRKPDLDVSANDVSGETNDNEPQDDTTLVPNADTVDIPSPDAVDSDTTPPPPASCQPQEVAAVGACRALVSGYYFDGGSCSQLGSGCTCEGADCDERFDTKTACQEAYSECLDDVPDVPPVDCRSDSDCTSGQFCDTAQPGSDNCSAPGVCVNEGGSGDAPAVCPDVIDPVCGCNGVKYDNRCRAKAAGVSVKKEGPCTESGTPTPTNPVCDNQSDCPSDDRFCQFPVGSCGEGNDEGECVDKPQTCNKRLSPVCGCDGTTYDNLCTAEAEGVNVESDGSCNN